ncbi:hypothetical protein LCGC14_0515440 [marine sediment metagenome]|uniref:TIR domain-containing protein n=1 Tax=marine sediment metagenome TaxID=412755 RepID=A0A0F9SIH2_9ZZZZ
MIFISHSRWDDSIAQSICDYLENHEIECGLDHWEEIILNEGKK